MARLGQLERHLTLDTLGIAPDQVAKRLAAMARREHARVMEAGRRRSGSDPRFERVVNGRKGASEDSVVLPGPIVYLYSYLSEVAQWGLEFARERSPAKSGRYKKSWFVMVAGKRVTDMRSIPSGSTIIITNDRPYHRKIDVGGQTVSVPPQIVEDTRQFLQRRFGNSVRVARAMIQLPGGYILKGHQRSAAKEFERLREKGRKTVDLTDIAAKQNRKSAAHRAGRAVLASRQDTREGEQMTYPALIITERARY